MHDDYPTKSDPQEKLLVLEVDKTLVFRDRSLSTFI